MRTLHAFGVALATVALLTPNVAFAGSAATQSNSTAAATQQPLMQRNEDSGFMPSLVLGTAWYPEHWPEERWEQDLSLMQAAGINMVRIGEFAWSRMEPSEGKFDLDWLDQAVSLASKHGIKVVLGTPTAAPPAWLTQKYPDTLHTDEHGQLATHGNREQYRPTSERYLQFCHRIAEEMAKRFGKNTDVIGWQIDNEYGPYSYDPETRKQFQSYLQKRYGTLDALNQHWSTSYWSQSYDNWEEIPIPVGGHNPGLMLEWKRFMTEVVRNYQHNQVEAIRAHADPRQFITHNLMGFYNQFDHYIVSGELDFASWDDYVGQGHLNPIYNGEVHDLVRGFKRQNFWVMETQPGSVNWAGINNALDKGEVRRMAWAAIGHGADAVSYWQWRSALGGQEQYHGTIVGADGQPRPLYEEISQIGKEFAKVRDALRDTTPKPETAILFDYASRWAIDFQKHNKDFDYVDSVSSYYQPLRKLTQDVDIVNPSSPLDGYKLVIAPSLNVLPDETAQHLVDYVKHGGHLVLGTRTGMKDQYNALLPSRQPGKLLSELLGGDVVDFYALEKPVPVNGQIGSGEFKLWAEMLESKNPQTETVETFGSSNGWLDGKPAIITRKVGAGRITYVGGQLDDNLRTAFAKWAVQDAGVQPVLASVPDGVEVCRRVDPNGKQLLIVINHTTEAKSITLPKSMHDLLTGNPASTSLQVAANDVAVLQ